MNQDPAFILAALRRLDIDLAVEDGNLNYRGQRSLVTDDVIEVLRQQKQALVGALESHKSLPLVFEATTIQRRYLPPKVPVGQQTPNNCVTLVIDAVCEESVFRTSVQHAARAHPMLNATFERLFKKIFLTIPAQPQVLTEWFDFSTHSLAEFISARNIVRAELAHAVFEPGVGKVARIAAIKRPQQGIEVVFSAHRAVADGAELMSFIHDLVNDIILEASSRLDLDVRLGHLFNLLGKLASTERNLCSSIDVNRMSRAVADHYPCARSTLSSVTEFQKQTIASEKCALDAVLLSRINKAAALRGTTPFVLMLACFAHALRNVWSGWNGMISFPFTLRETEDELICPGPRVNVLPMRVLPDTENVESTIRAAREKIAEIWRFGMVPIDYLREHLSRTAPERLEGWTDIWFNYLRFPFIEQEGVAARISEFDMVPAPGDFQYKVYIWPENGGIIIRYVYDTTSVTALDARLVLDTFVNHLSAISDTTAEAL